MGKKPLTMKFIAAYAMCKLGGNDAPGVSDVKAVLAAASYEWTDDDQKKVEDFVEEMAGADFYAKIEAGLEKTKGTGGGGGGGGGAPAAGGDAPAAAEKKKSSSSSDDGGGGGA